MKLKNPSSIGLCLFVVALIHTSNRQSCFVDSVCPLTNKKLTYELHGTKTIYSDALNTLRDEDQLVGSFDDDSLKEEHKDLLKDGCKPVLFYFVGRHSARFPDADDIEANNKVLLDLQAKLRFIAKSLECQGMYKDLLEWKPSMTKQHDNLITDLGGDEQRELAKRFKKLYPQFFSSKTADIKFANTKKIRTAQTAVEFLQEVDGWQVDNECKNTEIPTNDFRESKYNLSKIINNECYKKLTSDHVMRELTFHDECEELQGKVPKNALASAIKDPKVVERIANKVSTKLQMPQGTIKPEMLESIYSTCKFENAIFNDSAWCSLFDNNDVEAFEYIEDVKSYLNNAYGQYANAQKACPLVSDLIKKLKSGMQMTGAENEKVKSYFYFSHAGAMKSFLAAFGIFEDKKSYTDQQVNDFIKTLQAPRKRNYRSSLIVPFSANMAFTLYRCQKSPLFGKAELKHKLLASVTEHPVKIKGCGDTDCNLTKFLNNFQSMEDCDLRQVCRPIKAASK